MGINGLRVRKMRPKVSIILVTYLAENQKYLDLALESVNNLDYPVEQLELIVSSSGEYRPTVMPMKMKTTKLHSDDRLHFSGVVNQGVRKADSSSEHYMIVSDDTIMTKNSLKNMVDEASGPQLRIIGAISNCDNRSKYILFFGFQIGDKQYQLTERFYRYDALAPYKTELMNQDSLYPAGVLIQEHICFYAVLIPRAVWFMVGELDEGYKSGQEDIDYCLRCKAEGVPVVIAIEAIIWHFGGATADVVTTKDLRDYNIDYFKQKWGKLPP